MPRVLRKLLGAEQYKAALDSLRDDAGKVSATAGVEFVGKLFEGLPQGN